MITFKVPIQPVAQPRPRARVIERPDQKPIAQIYNPKAHPVTAFKAAVKAAFRSVYGGSPLEGPLQCDITFVMARPKNRVWKTKPMPRELHTKKPDRDNLDKAVMDALSKLAWKDDSQVCDGTLRKRVASGDEQPHAEITISRLCKTCLGPVSECFNCV